ncbi:MAG TPA: cysteine--tRNA ligase [Candidatus Paceibacterota bacterium]|nr:cysteine--tRNA ligase [Candidatus Paceibacterota bacterium]
MTEIHLTNTMTGRKEAFKASKRALWGLGKPLVGMYHCGPTVYNYAHIGNLRAYVFADTLKRLFKASGYSVKQVINITDVGHLTSDADTGEDKMEKAKAREHKSAWDIAKFYTDAFFGDLAALNVDVSGTKFPRATDFIKEQIALVKTLERKGFTYRTSDGIYFDTFRFSGYGKLGKVDVKGLREGERIGVNEEKKNATDFALWKFSLRAGTESAGKRDMEWKSPWGVGFPGWHIECSAMAASLLGTPVDIHTGGIDHIPVHHNNEIAQSEAATGHEFARVWMHSAFVNIDGGKMAKSEGNFITLQTLAERGYSPMAYRYFLLGARYSTPMNFTWDALAAAATAYGRLQTALHELPEGGRASNEYWNRAVAFVADDLDTPKALALCWDALKDDKLSPADKKATLAKIDSLLGIMRDETATEGTALPADVERLANERAAARTAKDWAKSDALRDEIAKLGYEVKDTPEGQKVSKR